MSNQLISIAVKGFQLDPFGAHGIYHWARVIDNGRMLALMDGDVNPRIPEVFGAFHDCRRVSEGADDMEHGSRGFMALDHLEDRFGLTVEEFKHVRTACIWHTTPLFNHELPIEVQICLDADRLDMSRIGRLPDSRYLFTESAKSPSMIDWAHERAKFNAPPDWLSIPGVGPVMIRCQQTDCIKIQAGIPKHGLQRVVRRRQRSGEGERVLLACRCTLPIEWLSKHEREVVMEKFPLVKNFTGRG